MSTEAEVKELIQDFVLITYDIPAKAATLRNKFLKAAKAIGAEQHTDSVYLIPYSTEAMALAAELESAGHAIIWQAHQPDQKKALEIMTKYEGSLKTRCNFIEQRLVIAQEYIQAGRLGVAQIMGIKTGKLLQQLAHIAENFKPPWLLPKIEELVTKWKGIYEDGEQSKNPE